MVVAAWCYGSQCQGREDWPESRERGMQPNTERFSLKTLRRDDLKYKYTTTLESLQDEALNIPTVSEPTKPGSELRRASQAGSKKFPLIPRLI